MSKRLREEDRRAVDLLLDRSSRAASAGTPVYAPADGELRERVARVSKLLSLLDAVPAGEPSPDLAARTLERVSDGRRRRGVSPTVPLVEGQRPHA